MSWTNLGYVLFQVGALLAAGIVMYGGWQYFTAHAVRPHDATGDDQPIGATPEAKPLPTLRQNRQSPI